MIGVQLFGASQKGMLDKMSTTTVAKEAKHVGRKAKQASRSEGVELWTRLGYIARGSLYVIIGLLAVQVALTRGGTVTDQNGVIRMLSQMPFGNVILILLAIGLAGYAVWGIIRAVFDPLNRGDDAPGLIERASYISSTASYAAFALVALYFASGWGIHQAGKPQEITSQLLSKPFGQWLVILFGLFWILAALGQFYTAFKAGFAKDLKLARGSPEHEWAVALGRFGYTARGVVFGIIGWFLVQAALTFDPNKAKGLDGALLELVKQPYGMILMGIVALGLLAFGLYSILCARWMRIAG